MLSVLTLSLVAATGLMADNDYGIPENIQDGNILHCFNWSFNDVKADLPNIAKAGYGAVQLSPLQRKDIQSNWHWYDLYCPYDIAFCESSPMGTRAQLTALCAEAEKYGIKVVVDVVANHINWTQNFWNTDFWKENVTVRPRSTPKCDNWGNRQHVTQYRLGDYFDVKSGEATVIARVKAYIEDLKSMGVKGIRWDAAKHIALPSEGWDGNFWKEVTSVPGMWHYGEILDSPGGSDALIHEYTQYMSVTDNRYSNEAGNNNGGVQKNYGGNWAADQGVSASKLVYWGESHDTYSNDEWSASRSQEIIDRAYACIACRNGSAALYFVRPNQKGFGNITITKGTGTSYRSAAISAVNNFRNKMIGRADFCSYENGNTFTVTRKGGGAVIVHKSSGNVTVTNGNNYVPDGTYTDRVTGTNVFTVSGGKITGTVGSTGIAVIYDDGTEVLPNPDPDPDPTPTPGGNITIYYDNVNTNFTAVNCYSYDSNGDNDTKWPGNAMKAVGGTVYSASVPAGSNVVFTAGNSGPQTVDVLNVIDGYIYTGLATKNSEGKYNVDAGQPYDNGGNEETDPTPTPIPDPDQLEDANFWVIGSSPSCGEWSPNKGFRMKKHDGNYVALEIQLEAALANDSKAYFSFASFISTKDGNSGWDELNAQPRFSPGTSNDQALSVGQTVIMTQTVNNGGIKAYTLPAGTYDLIVDPTGSAYTLKVMNGGEYVTTAMEEIEEIAPLFSISVSSGEIRVDGLNAQRLVVAGIDGRIYHNATVSGAAEVNVGRGIYIVNIDGQSTKLIVR